MMEPILQKAAKIKCVICDVDGVFTNGLIYLTEAGDEIKGFNILDGLGIKLLLRSGIDVAIITSKETHIVLKRMQSLGIKHIFQGQQDKLPAFTRLLEKLNLSSAEAAYVGDDLPDLPLIRRAGLGIAVANADPLLKQYADWQTKTQGGKGAIREVCELILKAQGLWEQAIKPYLL